ncbi:hypothetical protein SDC9_191417 [bioreactor metagenome]|uniref:Uncharacterized protein n=1 Tax=bioreactor metagenome TaxID=1076179 RepID=A0A645HZ42_9ZZZZ
MDGHVDQPGNIADAVTVEVVAGMQDKPGDHSVGSGKWLVDAVLLDLTAGHHKVAAGDLDDAGLGDLERTDQRGAAGGLGMAEHDDAAVLHGNFFGGTVVRLRTIDVAGIENAA